MSEPFLTLFSTPKPCTDPHISMIQRNAIQSWKQLGDKVEVVLIGEEPGVKEMAKELDVHLIPEVRRNEQRTPLVSSIFEQARSLNASPLLGYINTDIIVFPDFLDTAKQVAGLISKFLLVGQRWDLNVESSIHFSEGWSQQFYSENISRAKLHEAAGSDYFVFPRDFFAKIPPFAVGRAGWDNWMIYTGRVNHFAVIDASKSITVFHQKHDYNHLPDGLIHRLQPETLDNIKLMGGRFAIYSLHDANYQLVNGELHRQPITHWRVFREISIFPSISLKSPFLGKIFYFLFNIRRALRDMKRDKKIQVRQK